MSSSNENVSMALFCDFENVALGVRDAQYEKFDIKPVLERLLLKGSIVVKKAYCDWERYKNFKATMHEANFELIEIPHVRQSGKNSADIRLVVDALDLCYTKSHVNTFVIISGDSDFSPLVSKLRENAKQVIGVGVKQSTSDLLIANCDEFIFYDDLVRESQHVAAKRGARNPAPAASKRPPDADRRRKDDLDARRGKAIDIAVETFEALVSERGDSGKIWASVLKEAIKRRKPDFNESYYGFRAFGNLLEEAQSRGLLEFGRDEKSGAYVYRANTAQAGSESNSSAVEAVSSAPALDDAGKPESRRRTRGGRKTTGKGADVLPRGAAPSDDQAFQDPDYEAPAYQEPEYQAPAEQAHAEQDYGDHDHRDAIARATESDQDPWGEPAVQDGEFTATEPTPPNARGTSRRSGGRTRTATRHRAPDNPFVDAVPVADASSAPEAAPATPTTSDVDASAQMPARPDRRPRRPRRATADAVAEAAELPSTVAAPSRGRSRAAQASAPAAPETAPIALAPTSPQAPVSEVDAAKPIRKTPSRSRRPRKATPAADE